MWKNNKISTTNAIAIIVIVSVLLGWLAISMANNNFDSVVRDSKEKQNAIENLDSEVGPLISIREEGGLCSYGLCWSEKTVYADGKWSIENGQKQNDYGMLQKPDILKIKESLSFVNINEVKGNKFVGICPTAYDGQKTILSIWQYGKEYKLDNCVYDFSKNTSLSRLLNILSQI